MNYITNSAFRLKRALIQLEQFVTIVCLSLLLILILVQLVARNFFESGFPVFDIITRHLVLFILFMGAALITENNNHIKIDILSGLLSTKQKEKINIILSILSSCICFLFAWYSAAFWLDEFTYSPVNERLSLYLSLILPTGFIILALHFLLLSITGINHSTSPVSKE